MSSKEVFSVVAFVCFSLLLFKWRRIMQHGVQGGWGKWVIRIGALSSIVVLGGCAVNPHPVDKQELANIIHSDHDAALAGMPGLAAPKNQEETIARALKYNLDHRTRM